jgi:hypothetical protein
MQLRGPIRFRVDVGRTALTAGGESAGTGASRLCPRDMIDFQVGLAC